MKKQNTTIKEQEIIHDCKNGGEFVERPAHTPEQKWCGRWFYCHACGSHYLIPSEELKAQQTAAFDGWLKEFKSLTHKKDREKFLKNHVFRKNIEEGISPWREN